MKLKLFITLVVAFISVLSSYGQKLAYEKFEIDENHTISSDDFIMYNDNQDELFSWRLTYIGNTEYPLNLYKRYIILSFVTKEFICFKEDSNLILTLSDGSTIKLRVYNNATVIYHNDINCYKISGMYGISKDQIDKIIKNGVKKIELISHPQNYVLELNKYNECNASAHLFQMLVSVMKCKYNKYDTYYNAYYSECY